MLHKEQNIGLAVPCTFSLTLNLFENCADLYGNFQCEQIKDRNYWKRLKKQDDTEETHV